MTVPPSAEEVAEPWCDQCKHYGNYGSKALGTPPWSICRFYLRRETCGRFVQREPYSWEVRNHLIGETR